MPAPAYLLAAFLAANGIEPVASADLMPSTFMAISVVTAGWKATTVRSTSANTTSRLRLTTAYWGDVADAGTACAGDGTAMLELSMLRHCVLRFARAGFKRASNNVNNLPDLRIG